MDDYSASVHLVIKFTPPVLPFFQEDGKARRCRRRTVSGQRGEEN